MGNCNLISPQIGCYRHRVVRTLATSNYSEIDVATDSSCDSAQFWSLNSQALRAMPDELKNKSFLADKAMTPCNKKVGLKSPKTAINLSSFPLAESHLDLKHSHV